MLSRFATRSLLAGAAGAAGLSTWAYADTVIEITDGASKVKITLDGGSDTKGCATKKGKDSCCAGGPGYKTPMDAYLNGTKETLLYVPCIQPDPNSGKKDYLATVDCDPNSPTYSKVRLRCALNTLNTTHAHTPHMAHARAHTYTHYRVASLSASFASFPPSVPPRAPAVLPPSRTDRHR